MDNDKRFVKYLNLQYKTLQEDSLLSTLIPGWFSASVFLFTAAEV